MVHLGFLMHTGPVQLQTLSKQSGVPGSFLQQLILDLKTAKLVKSTRGVYGGYQLARCPSLISIGDIFFALGLANIDYESSNPLASFWRQMDRHMTDFLAMSLQSTMTDVEKTQGVLSYQI